MLCTTLNSLYTVYDTLHALCYVEWFALSPIVCTYNVECVWTTQKDMHCCWMIWTVQWNFLLENIPWRIASEVSLPWKSQQRTLSHKKSPLLKIPPVEVALQQQQQQKNRLSLKFKTIKIKASSIGILQKSSWVYQNYFRL